MLRRIVNYWRCANTDLLMQGVSSGESSPQQNWNHNLNWPQKWLERRGSQSVLCNTVLTIAMFLSLVYLFMNQTTRPQAIWLSLILTYFCVVTGTLEIPDYRYRLIVEPIVAATLGSAWAVLMSKKERVALIAD